MKNFLLSALLLVVVGPLYSQSLTQFYNFRETGEMKIGASVSEETLVFSWSRGDVLTITIGSLGDGGRSTIPTGGVTDLSLSGLEGGLWSLEFGGACGTLFILEFGVP